MFIMCGYVDVYIYVFFFNDTATTEIYTLSLHDALPIYGVLVLHGLGVDAAVQPGGVVLAAGRRRLRVGDVRLDVRGRVQDRKSTRLNSSHANISYAVFCLKKKKSFLTQHPPVL